MSPGSRSARSERRPAAAQSHKKIKRARQQQGRGVKAGSGAGKMNCGDSAAEDGGESVAQGIEDHNDGVGVGDGPEPARIAESEGREEQK